MSPFSYPMSVPVFYTHWVTPFPGASPPHRPREDAASGILASPGRDEPVASGTSYAV